MRGYSGIVGDRVNLERIEHISGSERLQSVCLSGSVYAKSGLRPPWLRRSLPFCLPFWVHFGVFGGRNGRYPPHKKNEGHIFCHENTTFSVATLGISTYMLFGQSVLQSHHRRFGFRYPAEGFAVLGQSIPQALLTLPSRWLLARDTLLGMSASFDTCPSLIQPGCLQGRSSHRRNLPVLGARKALVLANAGCGCL